MNKRGRGVRLTMSYMPASFGGIPWWEWPLASACSSTARLEKETPPRFVVTPLPATPWAAQAVYEELYCARGDMENRLKEQQLDLCADGTSTATRWSNQLRRYFSSCASLLLQALRRLGLHGTEMAHAQCGTIRLRLLKIGTLLTIGVRRIRVALASGYPYATLLQQVYARVCMEGRDP